MEVPTKDEVLRLVDAGWSYEEIGRVLGIRPGLAYLLATGIPADGGDTVSHEQRKRPGILASRSQRLVNPREFNPTTNDAVAGWVRQRAAAG